MNNAEELTNLNDPAAIESMMGFDSVRVKMERAAAMIVRVPHWDIDEYRELFNINVLDSPDWFMRAVGVADQFLRENGHPGIPGVTPHD